MRSKSQGRWKGADPGEIGRVIVRELECGLTAIEKKIKQGSDDFRWG